MKEIPLNNVYNNLIVDDEDFDILSTIEWSAHTRHGHVRESKRSGRYVHRMLLNAPLGMVVDHVDGNPFNNQKKNLRLCHQSMNAKNRKNSISNTSGYKGVSFDKNINKWHARIGFNKKRISLGYFDIIEDALMAYEKAAIAIYGEFKRDRVENKIKILLKPTKFEDDNIKPGIVPLGNKRYAIVDIEDYENVMNYSWSFHSGGYATCKNQNKSIYLHRFIMDAPKSLLVDHINGNKIDCRKENLRLCTAWENNQNRRVFRKHSSAFKGVTKRHTRWQAHITVNKKFINLGSFSCEREAAKKYDENAIILFGEFAALNFPQESLVVNQ